MSDFKLMFSNCRLYNEEGSTIYEVHLLTWVTWWLISVGPGGSSLEMLWASVVSARSVHQ